MKRGVAKFQRQWGTAAVISTIKPGCALLLAARCIPSSTQQLSAVDLHASSNVFHHPAWHGTERGLLSPRIFFVTAKWHKFTEKLIWGCTHFTTDSLVGQSLLLQCAP